MYNNVYESKVMCPICNKLFGQINNSHLKSHNLTFEEFKILYPNCTIHSPEMKKSYGSQSKESRTNLKLIANNKKQQRIVDYNLNPNKCLKCNNIIDYIHRSNKFCSRSCSVTHNQTGRKKSLAFRQNLSNIFKNKINNGEYIRPIRKIPYIKKVYELNCKLCNKTFINKSKTAKTCSKSCKSEWHSINNFKQNKTTGKCGYYNGIWCASSWELAFLIYKTIHGYKIERCKEYFTYQHPDGSIRKYFPDFKIGDIIYEVKGRFTEEVDSKIKAVTDNNIKIELVSRDEILPMIKYIKDHFNIKDITILYS